MPTYEYRCSSCGQHIEVAQSFADDPLTECAACGGQLRKVFSPIGIVLKGSGFYRTDSRTSSSRTAGEKRSAETSSESSSGSPSGSSSSESTSGSSSSGSADSKTA